MFYLKILSMFYIFIMFSSPLLAKENIYILATGGTIAGAQASKNGPGYKAGSFKIADLIAAVPQNRGWHCDRRQYSPTIPLDFLSLTNSMKYKK